MKKLLLASLLSLSMMAPSSNAHAFGIVTFLANGDLAFVGAPQTLQDYALTALCIVTLPFCVLDESAPSSEASLSPKALLDNGYSESEIQNIIQGQKVLTSWLAQNNKGIVREGSMSPSEMKEFMNSIEGMTPEYAQFFVEN